jgi:8-oxo-dGTP diphosphatase
MTEKVQVVAAIIERSGRFLFGKRSPHRLSAPGYWCTVTGRIEPGESQADAVVREVREEVGLEVRALQKVGECDTHDGTALIHWWLAAPLDDAPVKLLGDEHTELRWVTLEEMRALWPVFAEDLEIIARAAEDRLPELLHDASDSG